mgnify:FL=1
MKTPKTILKLSILFLISSCYQDINNITVSNEMGNKVDYFNKIALKVLNKKPEFILVSINTFNNDTVVGLYDSKFGLPEYYQGSAYYNGLSLFFYSDSIMRSNELFKIEHRRKKLEAKKQKLALGLRIG